MSRRARARFAQIAFGARRAMLACGLLLAAGGCTLPPAGADDGATARFIKEHYHKTEVMVPMRDGVRLHTTIYAPRRPTVRLPFLMLRTPYGSRPYGPGRFPERLGPAAPYAREEFIFVSQDVRGCYLSEGTFTNMTPHRDRRDHPADVDESTDTFDTIAWLLDNVRHHNGKVGLWGISYPGFYAAAGMIDAHPALAAVSPQAPIADWYFDDFFHHGAFFLPHAFNFFASFGRPRPAPTTRSHPRFDHGTPDGYRFFLELGPLVDAGRRHFQGDVAFWNEIMAHPTRDAFWQERDLLPHLTDVAPAVLVVGGWFDAEDLYGPLAVYRAVENKNPAVENSLVMGPWAHGGWSRGPGDHLGNVPFGGAQSEYYREHIELPFFRRHLKGTADPAPAEATVFETGRNRWRRFAQWPPAEAAEYVLYFAAEGLLAAAPPREPSQDPYTSDPRRPVPFSEAITTGMTREYMTDDQRFAARRPDVLVYQTAPLTEPVTLAGPLVADLLVSTTAADADFVVKLIDVFPDDAPGPGHDPAPAVQRPLAGYQMMVRSEVFRGRYRRSYTRPEPFTPGEPEVVSVPLLDLLHTFEPGHRIMVHVQSTWFPLVDRNPQKWVDNIFLAGPDDFVPALHTLFRGGERASRIRASRIVTAP